ncbi:MAG TPA: oxygen-independent coproporphyrinogen III oxidase [Gammaproteobacteria bacterium]|nr:oxygen-independent coproporphyrinogen III oxidase [Gammaproteobacteria bacterium]
MSIGFSPELIKKYDVAGPRYTSYPTAVQFTPAFGARELAAQRSVIAGRVGGGPLSLYVHVPFCSKVCFYCACTKLITNNRARGARYLQRLLKEIPRRAALHGGQAREVRQLHLGGGTPTFLSVPQLTELVTALRGEFGFAASCETSIEVDPRTVSPETIAALRELGFNRLSLGIQDFDSRVQVAVNRVQSESQIVSVVAAARAAAYESISFDLIYGLPLQNPESFARTIDKVVALRPNRLSLFNYAHLPHLFKSQRQIDAALLPSPDQKLALLGSAIARLGDAGYDYIGMDHFALPDDELARARRDGTLHRNFQGYSTHAECDLLGLGMSAISAFDDCFVQNSKDVDDYQARVDAGELPITRGYALSDDDRLRREIIMALACQGTIDRADVERRWGIAFGDYFADELARLEEMQADGLVSVDAAQVRIGKAGMLLLRNICMVFDRYLRHHDSQPRYSRAI